MALGGDSPRDRRQRLLFLNGLIRSALEAMETTCSSILVKIYETLKLPRPRQREKNYG